MIITLKADTVDYVVLNDGVTELETAIKDIVSEDKLTVGIITAVGDTKYQPIGAYVTNSELDSKGYLTTIPDEYVTDSELEAKGYLTSIPEEYVTDSELNSKGYLTTIPGEYITESELEAKGYLTEHQSLKTINGESLVGSGDITISGGGDMTNYYTKTEIDNLVGNINNELESI